MVLEGIFSYQFNAVGKFYYWSGAGDLYKGLRGSIEVIEGLNERELELSVSLEGFPGLFFSFFFSFFLICFIFSFIFL